MYFVSVVLIVIRVSVSAYLLISIKFALRSNSFDINQRILMKRWTMWCD